MKSLALFVNLLAVATVYAQTADPDALWDQLEKEAKWQEALLEVHGVRGPIKAYVTDSGEYKLEYVNDQMTSEARVESPEFSKYKDQEQYLRECESNVKIFPALRELKTPYLLTVPVVAPRSTDLDYTAVIGGSRAPVTQLTTRFQPIDFIKVKIEAGATSFTVRGGELSLIKLEEMFTTQLQARLEEVTKTGEIRFELSSYDDIACDLIAGRMKVRIQTNLHYTRAKLRREPRLAAHEINKVYEYVRTRFKTQSTLPKNLVLGSAHLGRALDKEVKVVPELSDSEVIRLHGKLFDSKQGELRHLANTEIERIAAEMDVLKAGGTYSNPVYDVEVNTPFKEKKK